MSDLIARKPSFDDIISSMEDLTRRMTEAEMPSGTQQAQLVKQMQDMVAEVHTITDGLDQRVDAQVQSAISVNSYTKPVIDSKVQQWNWGVLATSRGGTNTTNAYNNLFSSGPYRAAWLLADGTLGTSQSSRNVKTDFHEPDITLEQLRAVDWIGYRYINDVNRNGDSALPRVGMIAEELDDAGLGIFVVYDDESLAPVSIDYTTLSVAAMHLAKIAHDRIDVLETRIQTLEKKDNDGTEQPNIL